MIDRVIEFSIRRRGLVFLAAFVLAVLGVVFALRAPVDAIPDLSENQVLVHATWPGHGPREVDDQVGRPLSLHLQGLDGVRVIRSSSDVEFALLSVILADDADPETVRRQIGDRLATARDLLPPGASAALGPDAAATGQIFWYTVEGPDLDLGRLRSLQDWHIRPQLASVAGVAEVASVGGFVAEYLVEPDPLRLQALGLSIQDVLTAIANCQATAAGDVLHKGQAEFVVRMAGGLGAGEEFDPIKVIRDLESAPLISPRGDRALLVDVARVSLGARPRRGALEKDGSEVVGGVVLMRRGENVLEVTRRLLGKVQELRPGLPPGVRILPCYDRTPLIESAVGTLSGALVEAMFTATVCVVVVLLHVRTVFVIVLTLPLAVLSSFCMMGLLRALGLADVQMNIMSLAGLAISMGVLVDSSVVMAENAMHQLQLRFGDQPVTGDVRPIVLDACKTVGRPIFFSVVIMLLSFLPVFALGGMEGKMFRPLAFTKTFAILAAAVLAITLVPALCTVFIRGRLRRETDSWVVRGIMGVYRPVLDYFLDRPVGPTWFLGATLVVGLAPLGNRIVFLAALAAALLGCGLLARSTRSRILALGSLVLLGLVAEQNIEPLPLEFLTPLDEGMVMDMPITVPRASIVQTIDDMKARDMVFCRFPEVDMVIGKGGRAETPTDPAPLDMIETMVNFRPAEFWPKRKLRTGDADAFGRQALTLLVERGLVEAPEDFPGTVNEATMEALPLFDAQMREFAGSRNREFEDDLGPRLVRYVAERLAADAVAGGRSRRPITESDLALLSAGHAGGHGRHLAMSVSLDDVVDLAGVIGRRMTELGILDDRDEESSGGPSPLSIAWTGLRRVLGASPAGPWAALHASVRAEHRRRWQSHTSKLNAELRERGPQVYSRLILLALLRRSRATDPDLARHVRQLDRLALEVPAVMTHSRAGHHHGVDAAVPALDPAPGFLRLQTELGVAFSRHMLLWPKDRQDLIGFGGELDRSMQMPGWTNVWTMPIQNRVDMLATGVNTTIGVRVLGRKLDDVVQASIDVAAVLRGVRGAADVVADPVRGKGYVEILPNRAKASALGLSVRDLADQVEVCCAGKIVSQVNEGRERRSLRVRYPRAWREDEESLRGLSFVVPPARDEAATPRIVSLSQAADVRVTEGPATIKSENGLPRNYVRLNVRGRDAAEFVEEARQTVAAKVALPTGVFLEWTGQFEHEIRARQTLLLVVSAVVGIIFLILWLTYHDVADAILMLLAVPGTIAGGLFCQWLFGYPLSVTVWIGYLACFGMATSTGIIMLVYLREAVARAGGLEAMTLPQLREAVLNGAVHRLRPKLLTEGTTILGLAPLLWATGTGSEVIRPMIVPVLGGLLVADEIIDLFLPVLFYWVRRARWARLHATDVDRG